MTDALLTISPEAIDTAMHQIFRDKLANGSRSSAIALDPDRVEHDIAKLVLTLVEALRKLLEMQAVRRMEAGKLSPEEEESLGLTLMRAEQKIHDLAREFGLEPKDLFLNLGPLGRLV
ncbi:MAG: gas vesicle protein K [Beijerinckiaceae bacterium]